jgi:hypothetical protein
VVDVEVLDHPSSLFASSFWQRGEWSDRRGWPSALTFHDGRLYLSAFDRFAGSVSDAYTSFSTDVEGDSAPVIRSIATSGMVPRWNVGARTAAYCSRKMAQPPFAGCRRGRIAADTGARP